MRVPSEAIPSAVIRFCFEYSENVFFNPVWWEKLSVEEKSLVRGHALGGVGEGFRPADRMKASPGLRLVDWKVRKIHTNASLTSPGPTA